MTVVYENKRLNLIDPVANQLIKVYIQFRFIS